MLLPRRILLASIDHKAILSDNSCIYVHEETKWITFLTKGIALNAVKYEEKRVYRYESSSFRYAEYIGKCKRRGKEISTELRRFFKLLFVNHETYFMKSCFGGDDSVTVTHSGVEMGQ
ncbi:unnamed protein product [Allacma fusca]|uniref:Uncharacterized protein n=1 Tax=Allacma fusca TaxID=39272 RepID=A0A8J2NT25_9HEXA|nr:unnamed protein product [Allacma fusca]